MNTYEMTPYQRAWKALDETGDVVACCKAFFTKESKQCGWVRPTSKSTSRVNRAKRRNGLGM
jgi:hypothetical protein